MASDQQQFDLGTYLNEQLGGAVVNQVSPDGSAQLTLPDGSTSKFNTTSFLKDQGIDPLKTKIQYNAPEQAIDDNPLGFADGLNMLMASPKGQEEGLKAKFGANNVMPGDNGEWLVNDKGVWKKAQPGFLSNVIANSPEMLGGVYGSNVGAGLGAAVGGVVGSVFPGIGTLAGIGAGMTAGRFIGAPIGAAIAHVIKTEGVEQLNLRSGLDAQQAQDLMGHETVNNLIWQTVLGTGAKVGSSVLKAVDKEGLAQIASKLLPGTSETDWRTVVRSGADGRAVKDNIQKMADWAAKRASSVTAGPDPMTKQMTTVMDEFMEQSRASAQKLYGESLDAIRGSGVADKAVVNVTQAANQFKETLMGLGVVARNANGEYIAHANPRLQEAGQILQIFDNKSISTLNKVLLQSQKFSGELKFNQVQALRSGIDDLLESTGYYKGGEAAISNQARRALMSYRDMLSKATQDGLSQHQVVKDGILQNAGKLFSDANAKYSAFREIYDDFAMPSKLGGDMSQKVNTLNRMLGPKGAGLEDSFSKLADATNLESTPILQKLQQLRAGRELSAKYTPAQGILSTAKEAALGGPRNWANRLSSVSEMRDGVANALNRDILSRMPVSPQDKMSVEARGYLADFVNKMNPDQKMDLITNPMALRQLWNSVENSPNVSTQFTNTFLQQADQRLKGQ